MLRTTPIKRHMMPRNQGVAPKYDTWQDKYDPWSHMRRMSKLVGTGFYIAPNWYNHFRMFPPLTHNFREEQTLNPQTVEEPVQEQFSSISEDRRAVREELAKRSRTLATSGMRYFNVFWVEKPLDDAERQYYVLRRSNGLSHEEALKKVLAEFYEKQALRRRSHMIQSEEAQMTGKFITMREAMSVVQLLGDAQRLGLAPHQFSEIAQRTGQKVSEGRTTESRVEKVVLNSEAENVSAESFHAFLSGSTEKSSSSSSSAGRVVDKIIVTDSDSDSVEGLKNLATASTGKSSWLDEAEGHTPKYSTDK